VSKLQVQHLHHARHHLWSAQTSQLWQSNSANVVSPFKDLESGTVCLLNCKILTSLWKHSGIDWKLFCLTCNCELQCICGAFFYKLAYLLNNNNNNHWLQAMMYKHITAQVKKHQRQLQTVRAGCSTRRLTSWLAKQRLSSILGLTLRALHHRKLSG